MKIHKIDHIGIVVKDIAAVKAFFLDFGLELAGEGDSQGKLIDHDGVERDAKQHIVALRTPDGEATIELLCYQTPTDPRALQEAYEYTPGIRHIAFAVEDIDGLVARLKANGTRPFSEIQALSNGEAMYKLVYIHGPEDIILELDEKIV